MSKLLRFASFILLVVLLVAVYLFLVRPGQLVWGATAEEIARPLPGDDLVADPTFDATRAITIDASPEQIWPWLVQWGYGRAGFYGYDLVENIGSPSGLRSADRLIPAYQQLAVGDTVKMNDFYDFKVRAIEPNRYIVLAGDVDPAIGSMTWSLAPIDANHTRLIHRFHMRYQWDKPDIAVLLFTDVADHVALRKIMQGIKDRVEGRAEPLLVQGFELGVYLLIVVEFIVASVLIFTHRKWALVWLLALIAGLTVLFALYAPAPLLLKAFVALGIGRVLILLVRRVDNPQAGQRSGGEEPELEPVGPSTA
ncbi:MAG TPA: SRPBCC family protein [Caldilineaceae bacterium]|nr:SRPBCC family protein [Caldilineaceae bacterium]